MPYGGIWKYFIYEIKRESGEEIHYNIHTSYMKYVEIYRLLVHISTETNSKFYYPNSWYQND